MAVTPGHGGGSATLPVEWLSKILTYALLGAVYSLAGYLKKREQGRRDYGTPVQFSWKRAGRTVLVGAVAGAVVAWQGQEFSDANLDMAMGVAVPVVDQLLNRERAKREQVRQSREHQRNSQQ